MRAVTSLATVRYQHQVHAVCNMRLKSARPKVEHGSIQCTDCDFVLLSWRLNQITFWGRMPLEVVSRPDGEPSLICCDNCGTLVPIEPSLLRIA